MPLFTGNSLVVSQAVVEIMNLRIVAVVAVALQKITVVVKMTSCQLALPVGVFYGIMNRKADER